MNVPIRLRQGGKYRFFFRNIWLSEPNVPEKDKKVPRCRRRSGLQVWHEAETSATA